jgi:hypothetical protein
VANKTLQHDILRQLNWSYTFAGIGAQTKQASSSLPASAELHLEVDATDEEGAPRVIAGLHDYVEAFMWSDIHPVRMDVIPSHHEDKLLHVCIEWRIHNDAPDDSESHQSGELWGLPDDGSPGAWACHPSSWGSTAEPW